MTDKDSNHEHGSGCIALAVMFLSIAITFLLLMSQIFD